MLIVKNYTELWSHPKESSSDFCIKNPHCDVAEYTKNCLCLKNVKMHTCTDQSFDHFIPSGLEVKYWIPCKEATNTFGMTQTITRTLQLSIPPIQPLSDKSDNWLWMHLKLILHKLTLILNFWSVLRPEAHFWVVDCKAHTHFFYTILKIMSLPILLIPQIIDRFIQILYFLLSSLFLKSDLFL